MADNTPAEQLNNQSGELPPAQELQPKSDAPQLNPDANQNPALVAPPLTKKRRRGSYRPSHKATFIALAVVALILVVNAVVLEFVLKHQNNSKSSLSSQTVTISRDTLNKLGVNDTAIGDAGIVLTVGPSARFNGNLNVAGTTNIAGQLTLNSTLSATSANITQLQAGNTSVAELNINGNATATNLNLRDGLVVNGTSQFQGAITATQPVSINSNLNVGGNLVVSSSLEAGSFEISNLTLSGHVSTVGQAPSVTAGPALGNSGTVSISGNDEAGIIDANAGGGATSGVVANVTFHTSYSNTPIIVVTPIGAGLVVYINRSDSGFSLVVSSSLSAGSSYAFNYIVEQ